MMPRSSTVLLLAAVLTAGCGAEQPRGDGRVEVHKSLAGGPVYMEGSLTRVTILDRTGRTVIDATQPGPGNGRVLARRLGAGRYRMVVRERPCQGSCGLLDPPGESTRCEREIEVRANRTTRVHMTLASAFGGVTVECDLA